MAMKAIGTVLRKPNGHKLTVVGRRGGDYALYALTYPGLPYDHPGYLVIMNKASIRRRQWRFDQNHYFNRDTREILQKKQIRCETCQSLTVPHPALEPDYLCYFCRFDLGGNYGTLIAR